MSESVVCVGAVVKKGDRVLLVRQAPGHQLEGQWTIPWGLLEAGESPSTAVVRETGEETGVVVEVKGLLGVQELPRPWEGWIALVYLCRHLGGAPRPDGRETDSVRYFSLAFLPGVPGYTNVPGAGIRLFIGTYMVIGVFGFLYVVMRGEDLLR